MCLINEEEAIYECDNSNCNAVVSFYENRECAQCHNDICVDCKDDNPICALCQEVNDGKN